MIPSEGGTQVSKPKAGRRDREWIPETGIGIAQANHEGSCNMRNYLAGSIVVVAAMLAFSTVESAQTGQGGAAGANQGPGHVGTNVPIIQS